VPGHAPAQGDQEAPRRRGGTSQDPQGDRVPEGTGRYPTRGNLDVGRRKDLRSGHARGGRRSVGAGPGGLRHRGRQGMERSRGVTAEAEGGTAKGRGGRVSATQEAVAGGSKSDQVSFAHASERQFAQLLDFYQIEWEY